jgi:cytochrome c oxidase subunit 2
VGASGANAGDDAAAVAERRWAMVSTVVIAFILAITAFTSMHWASMPTSAIEPIDPTTLHVAGEFVEQNLGPRIGGDGAVIVRLIAQQYSFNPQCIVVPARTKVTFRGTSADVVHGFLVTGSTANAMLVPGYVTTFIAEFSEVGDRLMPCHEFCGTGHAAMWAHVRVVEPGQFARLAAAGSAVLCD